MNLKYDPGSAEYTPLEFRYDTSKALKPSRKTDIENPDVKFVDLRDGFQGGDCVINSVKDAVTVLMLIAPFAYAYDGGKQFELGFSGSSPIGDKIIEVAHSYLKAMGMEASSNTFARTLKKGPDGEILQPLSDQALCHAVEHTREQGIDSMTFVAKGTPRQARLGLGVKHEDDHIMMVHRAFKLAHDNGVKDLTLDPEHTFDALISDDPEDQAFFIKMVVAAYDAGCRRIVLCDTNGDHIPQEIADGIQWIHEGAFEFIQDDELRGKWKEIVDNCQWGLHLHDDLKASARSIMDSLDTELVDHLDMTWGESGERGGGNTQFAFWAANMYQEKGIDVFNGNKEIWKLVSATVHRVNFLMHRNHLSPRAHFFGMLAAAQSAGMHTNTQTKGKGEKGETSNLYRPNAYGLDHSVLDILGMDETFSLTRMAGKDNIAENMKAMGLGDYIEEKGSACYEIISDYLIGDMAKICYTKNLASAALRMYEQCTDTSVEDLLHIEQTKVEATVRDGHSHAEARICFENGNKVHEWFEAESDQGILDAQFEALYGGLKIKNSHLADELGDLELLDYHQENIGKGPDSRVVTQIVFRDKKTGNTWANVVVKASSFNSAYECMKEGIRYMMLTSRNELEHIQDPHLDRMYGLDTNDLIHAAHTASGLNADLAIDFLGQIDVAERSGRSDENKS